MIIRMPSLAPAGLGRPCARAGNGDAAGARVCGAARGVFAARAQHPGFGVVRHVGQALGLAGERLRVHVR